MLAIFNEYNIIDLVGLRAEEVADQIQNKTEGNKNQIRTFFNELRFLQNKMKAESYEKNEIELKLLIPKVQYAAAKKQNKIDLAFTRWLSENLRTIKCREDMDTFVMYFEAVLGYFFFSIYKEKEDGGGGSGDGNK